LILPPGHIIEKAFGEKYQKSEKKRRRKKKIKRKLEKN
jgi:hypothetical protein